MFAYYIINHENLTAQGNIDIPKGFDKAINISNSPYSLTVSPKRNGYVFSILKGTSNLKTTYAISYSKYDTVVLKL